jgi:hypothetical protein
MMTQSIRALRIGKDNRGFLHENVSDQNIIVEISN